MRSHKPGTTFAKMFTKAVTRMTVFSKIISEAVKSKNGGHVAVRGMTSQYRQTLSL